MKKNVAFLENVSCTEEQVKCDGHLCITKFWVCDGDKDCEDGSDEDPEKCRKACPSRQFTCNITGRCIPKAWACDSDFDCGENDTSDEANCGMSIFFFSFICFIFFIVF